MITQQEYQNHIDVVLSQSGSVFLQLRLDHIRYLKGNGDAAAVLSLALNYLRMKHSNIKDRKYLMEENLWFLFPAKTIQQELGMNKGKQLRIVKLLTEQGILDSEHRKANLLWIRLNPTKLEEIEKWDREVYWKQITQNELSL